MTSITITSDVLGETFTFTMPSDGGYVRVGDGSGEYNQIFKPSGAAVTAYSEKELRKAANNYINRCIRIDARQYHDPAQAPRLVEAAIDATGSQREVADRCGLSREYLRRLAKGEGEMSYGVQVMLEAIIRES